LSKIYRNALTDRPNQDLAKTKARLGWNAEPDKPGQPGWPSHPARGGIAWVVAGHVVFTGVLASYFMA